MSKIYKNFQSKSKIECGALCSIEPMEGCNSFVFNKKLQSCSLANLEGNSGLSGNLYQDAESYISVGN